MDDRDALGYDAENALTAGGEITLREFKQNSIGSVGDRDVVLQGRVVSFRLVQSVVRGPADVIGDGNSRSGDITPAAGRIGLVGRPNVSVAVRDLRATAVDALHEETGVQGGRHRGSRRNGGTTSKGPGGTRRRGSRGSGNRSGRRGDGRRLRVIQKGSAHQQHGQDGPGFVVIGPPHELVDASDALVSGIHQGLIRAGNHSTATRRPHESRRLKTRILKAPQGRQFGISRSIRVITVLDGGSSDRGKKGTGLLAISRGPRFPVEKIILHDAERRAARIVLIIQPRGKPRIHGQPGTVAPRGYQAVRGIAVGGVEGQIKEGIAPVDGGIPTCRVSGHRSENTVSGRVIVGNVVGPAGSAPCIAGFYGPIA